MFVHSTTIKFMLYYFCVKILNSKMPTLEIQQNPNVTAPHLQ